MHRLVRRSSVMVAVLAVAAVAGLIASCGTSAEGQGSSQGRGAVPAGALSLTVTDRATGRPVPAGFLGLSLEFNAVEPYTGTDPAAINPVFEQLVRNLTPNQAPNLRIGGDSTDWTWWPVPGMTKPPGVRIIIDDRWGQVTSALTRALGAHLILGVDLEANSPRLAAYEAEKYLQIIGRRAIEGVEPGNEPELYPSFSWYVNSAGVGVKGRPKGYDYPAYKRDFSQWAHALPRVPLAGPATGAPKWMPELANFLTAQPRVKVATLHRYPVQQCFIKPSSLQYPTVSHLLNPHASRDMADSVAPYVGVARSHHVPLRIDEMNTVSCGGAPGVADGFVSALWALDATFQMARVGVDGVNFHTYPGAPYELFTFTQHGGRWQGTVAPEYYGLMMFAKAVPPGARLLRLSGNLGNVKAWATRAPDGAIRVVLINEYTAQSRTVAVRIAGARGTATLERLRAPSLTSTGGVTLGGQSFGSATRTGQLAGHSSVSSVKPGRGAYLVKLPRASAAMLTIPAPPG